MKQSPQRIQFLDIMRGFAVIVMVMGHSIDSVLSVEVRSSDFFRMYDTMRGFTAPIFLFVSGFAYIVATEKRWDQLRSFGKPLVKRLLRILLLFVIGYALHFPFLSFSKLATGTTVEEYQQFLQADVLHCVGASLLLLHIPLVFARTPRAFALSVLGMTVGVATAAPLMWQVDYSSTLGPVIAPYLNQKALSIFPIFPYSAYLFSGVVVGHFSLAAGAVEKQKSYARTLVAGAAMLIACGLLFEFSPWTLYPPHDFWKASPNFFLIRIGVVMFVTVGFLYLRNLPPRVATQLITLGKASLLVYTAHLIVVYGSAVNKGLAQVLGKTLGYHEAIVAGLCVLCIMFALVHFWNYLRTHHQLPTKVVQFGLTSTILYFFFTQPY
ncbi:MAG: DUF1624 domain-containing protein [Ignavibacteriae bacterium]|nr:DUF1624 domain-containing protein [Ignavibacteriota bacterium]